MSEENENLKEINKLLDEKNSSKERVDRLTGEIDQKIFDGNSGYDTQTEAIEMMNPKIEKELHKISEENMKQSKIKEEFEKLTNPLSKRK